MTDTINLLACSNSGFFQHLATMLASVATNAPSRCFNVVVVTGDGPGPVRDKLERSIARFLNVSLAVRQFSPDKGLGLYTPGNYTTDNYARLWVADFFGPEVDRVLYLDADMVALSDISELWAQDLEGKLFGAVDIPGSTKWRELGMPGSYGYFNSGLLLVDLAAWRRDCALERLLAVLKDSGTAFRDVDQDALNVCFHAERKTLDYKWNVITPFYFPAHDLKLSPIEVSGVRKDARIVHFNGRSRPWSYHSRHPRKPDYYKYLAMTEWRDFRPPDRTPSDIARKHLGPLVPMPVRRLLRRVVG